MDSREASLFDLKDGKHRVFFSAQMAMNNPTFEFKFCICIDSFLSYSERRLLTFNFDINIIELTKDTFAFHYLNQSQ